MKKNRRLRVLSIFLAGLVGILTAASPALAERLTSDSFVITFGNFNTTSGEKESASYNVTDTVGQTFQGPFGSYGSSSYFVGAGFQYIYQMNTFSFRVSQTALDLGELTTDVHNTASHTVTITTKGAGGYNVYAYEINPLRHSNGVTIIPDTTCNAGTCSETTAQVWTTQAVSGFGFNANGNDVAADFVNNTYFRQFANREAAESMQSIMSSANVGEARTATITYKAGPEDNQAAGNYQTGIVYVAVPGY